MIPEAYCLHREFAPEGPLPFEVDRHYLLYASSGTMRWPTSFGCPSTPVICGTFGP